MSIALRKAVAEGKVKLDKNGRPPRSWHKLDMKDIPSATRKEFLPGTNINRIVDRYTKTGVLPFAGRDNLGIYADVSEVPSYKSALEFVIHAQESFEKLDANVRKRFHNSPQELLEFLKDDDNRDEAIKLGLVDKEVLMDDIVEPPQPPAPPEPPNPEE